MRSLLVVLLVSGCAAARAPAPSLDQGLQVVDDGKADNFYSTTAREYTVEGDTTVTLEADLAGATDDAKLARARELANLKNVVIGWFLNIYLQDKESQDANHTALPGYHAMVRDGGWSVDSLTAESDLEYRYHFKLQVAGETNLLDALGSPTFELAIGKISNADMARLDPEHEWFRDPQWDSASYDPAHFQPDKLEKLTLSFAAQPQSSDAYIDYNRLFADGELTVGVHFGWDYWDRYDIKNSQRFYEWLMSNGFASPASDYAHYDADTNGPLTKTVHAGGRDVNVKVWVFHPGQPGVAPGPDPDTDQGGDQLNADMYESLRSRDVVVFDGHSGNYYGFALANWRMTSHGAIDYPQIASAEMPHDYQIVLANGCQTYSIGEAFWANPQKADKSSLNIITTTTFSDASTPDEVEKLMDALFVHPAKSWNEVLTDQNGSWGIGAMYGVHGLDANPRLHPFSDLSFEGKSCAADADCGAEGNRCVHEGSSAGICAAICLDSSGCPDGTTCKALASGTSIVARACIPTN